MSFLNFERYSIVIKLAIIVNKAVLDDLLTPALGLNIANVLDFIVEADPKVFLWKINTPSFDSMIFFLL